MRTYELRRDGRPLYIQIYEGFKADLLSGEIRAGEKLPSKRALAEHLGVSKLTVETAYSMLLAEGYISSRERSGYYAERIAPQPYAAPGNEALQSVDPQGCAPRPTVSDSAFPPASLSDDPARPAHPADSLFPYSVWAKLMRSVILDSGGRLLSKAPRRGLPELREAIAGEILRERGVRVDPARVVVGAGTEYFYSQIVQFLGRDKGYALEDPSYPKIARSYRSGGAEVIPLRTDGQGIDPAGLRASGAKVLHISPAHHYPTGTVTPIARRRELAEWLAEDGGRFIIEDEYDSEFSFMTRPVPSMQSMDRTGRVIFLNTFSRTLAPSLRMSYMLLPEELLDAWEERMGFYSCAVPVYEQMVLARFISEGFYERHLRRLNRFYAARRRETAALFGEAGAPADAASGDPSASATAYAKPEDRSSAAGAASGDSSASVPILPGGSSQAAISESFELLRQGPGLHFLLRARSKKARGETLRRALSSAGIDAPLLSDMYIGEPDEEAFRTAVMSYSMSAARLGQALASAAESLR